MTWTDGVGGKDLKKKSTYRKTPAEKKKKKFDKYTEPCVSRLSDERCFFFFFPRADFVYFHVNPHLWTKNGATVERSEENRKTRRALRATALSGRTTCPLKNTYRPLLVYDSHPEKKKKIPYPVVFTCSPLTDIISLIQIQEHNWKSKSASWTNSNMDAVEIFYERQTKIQHSLSRLYPYEFNFARTADRNRSSPALRTHNARTQFLPRADFVVRPLRRSDGFGYCAFRGSPAVSHASGYPSYSPPPSPVNRVRFSIMHQLINRSIH